MVSPLKVSLTSCTDLFVVVLCAPACSVPDSAEVSSTTMVMDSEMMLKSFCAKVAQIPLLRRARILATECYVAKTKVQHRHLILELQPTGTESRLWLRIDRRRAPRRFVVFVLELLTSRAHDTVRIDVLSGDMSVILSLSVKAYMSADKYPLIELDSRRENRQEFKDLDMWTLGDFCQLLQEIMRKLVTYVLYRVRPHYAARLGSHSDTHHLRRIAGFLRPFFSSFLELPVEEASRLGNYRALFGHSDSGRDWHIKLSSSIASTTLHSRYALQSIPAAWLMRLMTLLGVSAHRGITLSCERKETKARDILWYRRRRRRRSCVGAR